jgi:MFS family permease
MTVPLVFIAPLAGRLYDRIGPRLITTAGAVSFGLALLWMAAVLGKQSFAWIIPAYLAIGVGFGLVLVPVATDAPHVAPPTRQGQASGVFATMSEIGGALGLATLGSVVAGVQQAKVDSFLKGAGVSTSDMPGIERFLAESMKGSPAQVPHGLPPSTFQASASALTSATTDAFTIVGGVMLAAATIAWLTLRRAHAGDE